MLMADGLDVTPGQDVRILTHVGRPATWVLWSCEEGEDGEDGVKTFLAEAASGADRTRRGRRGAATAREGGRAGSFRATLPRKYGIELGVAPGLGEHKVRYPKYVLYALAGLVIWKLRCNRA